VTKLLIALATTVALVGPAVAGTSTYMCQVGHKFYPVTLTTPNEDSLRGATITWRGVTFRNVKFGEGCKTNFVATRDGVTVELCTATQGAADLTIGGDTFECQLKADRGIPQKFTGTWCTSGEDPEIPETVEYRRKCKRRDDQVEITPDSVVFFGEETDQCSLVELWGLQQNRVWGRFSCRLNDDKEAEFRKIGLTITIHGTLSITDEEWKD
jgi:hypothetical protein